MMDETQQTQLKAAPSPTLEAWLFDRMPAGMGGSIAIIFLIPVGLFVGISLATGHDLVERSASGSLVAGDTLVIALLLSAIWTAALALGAGSARFNAKIAAELAMTLRGGREAVARLEARQAGTTRRNVLAVIIGLAAGIGINIYPFGAITSIDLGVYLLSPGLWFLIMSPLLFILLARAILSMADDGRGLQTLARDELIVDLDHPDRLHVYGRLALRSALSWLIFAAIGVAFLGTGASWIGALPMMSGAAILAAASFFLSMRPVRDRVAEAKAEALEQLRRHLAETRHAALAGDRTAMAALAGLTSYEGRLERLREWPVSAPVTTRLLLYILIPVAAWIGAALAERLVEAVTG